MSGSHEVVVVGGGIGGICAAVAAARAGARTLLLERAPQVGGTGVHSPVALICRFWDSHRRPINSGLHRELFPWVYPDQGGRPWERVPVYDEDDLSRRYRALLGATPGLQILTSAPVDSIDVNGSRVARLRTPHGPVSASVYIDATANGNLSALAGAATELGRTADGLMQPATLTFKVTGFDLDHLSHLDLLSWDGIRALRRELLPYYLELKARGETSNPRDEMLCFPYPDGRALLFNQTRINGVDPTNPASLAAAREEGEKQVLECFRAIRRHPAFHHARLAAVSSELGIREGRRVVADYMLTASDCLTCARFDDMVAACAYSIDIHDPTGGGTRLQDPPPPGYFHIPYRSLCARDRTNLLLGSRCIGGSHEAHSAYRVMSCVSSIGQAAGVAAALAARLADGDVRAISAARIRHVLATQGQFVEGDMAA